jgi:hypothetical protein
MMKAVMVGVLIGTRGYAFLLVLMCVFVCGVDFSVTCYRSS